MGWDWSNSTPSFDSSTATFDGSGGTAVITPPPVTLPTVGTQSDVLNRLQRLIPQGWFSPGEVPFRDALLAGVAGPLSTIYQLLAYLRNQTRLLSMSEGWLDMFAGDFFGPTLYRSFSQSDTSFKASIRANLFRERNTRQSVINILKELTGFTPFVFEPSRVPDTGAYNVGTMGYGVAGGYGGRLPYQSFVVAYAPLGSGIPNVAGYGIPTGAYSTASQSEYVDKVNVVDQLTDADLFAAVESVRPAGYTIWMKILPGSSAPVQ